MHVVAWAAVAVAGHGTGGVLTHVERSLGFNFQPYRGCLLPCDLDQAICLQLHAGCRTAAGLLLHPRTPAGVTSGVCNG
jgi:hypothetical protein